MADDTEGTTEESRILHRISAMVAAEKDLRGRLQADTGDETSRAQLRDLEVELDQCWDLLRQRRALADAGEDPGHARVRPAGEVEGYLN